MSTDRIARIREQVKRLKGDGIDAKLVNRLDSAHSPPMRSARVAETDGADVIVTGRTATARCWARSRDTAKGVAAPRPCPVLVVSPRSGDEGRVAAW